MKGVKASFVRVAAALLAVLVGGGGLAWWSHVTAAPAEGQRIVRIAIRGASRVSAHRILGQMRLREGSLYTPEAVDEDLKRIYALREFDNVTIQPEPADGGLALVVEVVERPILLGLEFEGNQHLKDEKLREAIGVEAGGLMDRHALFTGAKVIERQYHEKGFAFAAVELDEPRLRDEQVARFIISEGPRVRVRKIRFVGNPSIGAGELRKQMETRPYFFLLSAGRYDEDRLERDLLAVRNYYIDQGFLDVRVGRELEFSDDREDLTVRVIVEEGPRYEVRSVALEGVDRFSRVYLKKLMETEPGVDYTAQRIRKDMELIQETYGEVGYIDAFVRPVIDFAEEPGVVDLTFRVDEGEPARIGRIRIVGNTFTQDKVIRRDLRFFPDEPVNTKLIEKARKRLSGSGLFEPDSVLISVAATDEPGVRDIVVRVEESQTSTLILGAGVNSNSGVVGNVSFVQRNFDLTGWPDSSEEFWSGEAFRGGGQLFQIVLEPGTELQRYRVDFREPHLMDSDISLSTSGFFFSRQRRDYDEERLGGSLGFGKELREDLTAYITFRLEAIDITDVDPGVPQDLLDVEGSSELTSVQVGLVKDTTDSVFFPTEGYRLNGSVEQAGALGGSYTFTRSILDARRYWTVTEDILGRKSVLAVRGRVGFIGGDAPIFERFYAGGHGSLRGFDFRGVGPWERNTPIGGDFLALAGAEYSFPIIEKNLSGVLFIDTGTVEEDISVSTWRVSVGTGLRFTVPFFGPVPFAFDFGFPVVKEDDDDEEVFSFSIGTTF